MKEKPFKPPPNISSLTEAGIAEKQVELARATSEELLGILMSQKDKPSGASVQELFSKYAEEHAKKMDPIE